MYLSLVMMDSESSSMEVFCFRDDGFHIRNRLHLAADLVIALEQLDRVETLLFFRNLGTQHGFDLAQCGLYICVEAMYRMRTSSRLPLLQRFSAASMTPVPFSAEISNNFTAQLLAQGS